MNTYEPEAAQLKAFTAGLESRCREVASTSWLAWQLRTPGNATVAVSLQGGWLHLEAPLPYRREQGLPGPRRTDRLLGSNSLLPCGMSYCVGPRSRHTYLVADYALSDSELDSDRLVDRQLQLFDTFCQLLDRSPREVSASCVEVPEALCVPLTVDDPMGEAARDLCAATGWEYHERGSGRLAITLDMDGPFSQSYCYGLDDEFRLGVTLEPVTEPSARSRHAMATFLLTASRVVRMARSAIVRDRSAREYRWEVSWPGMPSSAQFHCGLSALSIACRMTIRELQALCDEAIANSYLSMRGRSSH